MPKASSKHTRKPLQRQSGSAPAERSTVDPSITRDLQCCAGWVALLFPF